MVNSSSPHQSHRGARMKSRKSKIRKGHEGNPRKPKKSLKMHYLNKIKAVGKGRRLSQNKPMIVSKMSVSQNLMLRWKKPHSKRWRSSSHNNKRRNKPTEMNPASRISHQFLCQRNIEFLKPQNLGSLVHQKSGSMVSEIYLPWYLMIYRRGIQGKDARRPWWPWQAWLLLWVIFKLPHPWRNAERHCENTVISKSHLRQPRRL